jgi:hypothetical protein
MDAEKEMEFKLESSDELVLLGSCLTTVQACVDQRRATNPKATVAYHEMEPVESTREAPCAPGKSRLKKSIASCLCQGRQACWLQQWRGGDQPTSVGAAIGLNAWQSAPGANIVWAMRWAPAGLMPVRPMVCIKGDGNVPARKALMLMECAPVSSILQIA